MKESICIIPITNFVIDTVFKLNDVYFSPPYTQEDTDLSFTDTINKEEFNTIQRLVKSFIKTKKPVLINSTLAITKVDNLEFQNIEEAFTLVDKVCEKIDRSMDYFRLTYCQIGNFETLPGIPGFIPEGFKTIYKWDSNTDSFETIPGEVSIMFQKGIGLMPDNEPILTDYNKINYKCLFSKRDDEVFLNCRSALTRVNEAMYMHNLNSAFIYLMTTIEMLADKDKQLNFANVKPRILPFITKSKKSYHEQSAYMRILSESKRTEIVHNGKNIYDLYDSKAQVVKELFRITGIIVSYVEKVWALDVHTFAELEKKRSELIKQLGV
ncbi:hypothetical protein H0178_07165 [Cytobacillus firmus]|nr:hypothetical protein [Cytobacillus firmus]